MRDELLREVIDDKPLSDEVLASLKPLIDYYGRVHGFMASHVYRASLILREGLQVSKLRILSFTANLVATGLRGLFAKLVKDGFFDIVITTCGTIDHDIAKAFGGKYYKGDFFIDDEMLHDLDIHRLGNILAPVENYGPIIEKTVRTVIEDIKGKNVSGHQLLWLVGKRINDENSILRAAYLKQVPIIVPGYYDGSFGTNVYIYSRLNNVTVDLSLDEKVLDDRVFASSNGKALGLIVGGGISKHHTIWWSQFRGGLDYTIYLTTAVEYDGSLSGAHSREAISWGKVKPRSKHVVVYGDATITLPIIVSSLYWREKPSPSL